MVTEEVKSKEWRVVDIIDWGKDYLGRFGIENPRLNVELLLGNVIGKKRLDLYLSYDRVLNAGELARFKSDILRRSKHEPVQYIIGSTEFYGIGLESSKECLIPRPETEILVQTIIERFGPSAGEGLAVLDIGTGSGNIVISLAKNLTGARFFAMDVSVDALNLAKKNAGKNSVAERIVFVEGDVFGDLPDTGKFDVIVSNPPYIRKSEYPSLPKEVREYEPALALLSKDEEGISFYEKIIEFGVVRLNAGGVIAFEVGDSRQAAAVEKLFEKRGLFSKITTLKDYNKADRVVSAELPR